MIDFFCPICGGETHTVDSRPTNAGNRRRRKICALDPDHRFSTVEITAEEYELLCGYRSVLSPAIQNFTKEIHDGIPQQSI